MIKHVSITIKGKVQGVGFRFCTIEKALELGLTGIVKNYSKDEVHIEVEGEVEKLQPFLKWCHRGPEGATIEKVDFASTEELQNYPDFSAEQ
ncbi:MAG: acylphosphatase [bacterium]|nr:acylphosphatase [bacterium]